MTSEWKEQELTESEAVEALQEDETIVPKKKRRTWPFLLLILILAGGAFVLFAPQEMKDRYLAPITKWLPDAKREIVKPVPTPKPQPAPAPASKPVVTEKPAPVTVDRIVPASSEEINRVLQAMNSLQGELTALQREQQELKQQQRAVQLTQLRTRLNWIANKANHLPQLQILWEEVSLMPVLSSDERMLAQEMLAKARDNLQQLRDWQQIMQNTSDSLKLKEHDNVIPVFDNSWLNWIAEQFSVRPSLSREEAEDTDLREKLINTSRNIEMEQWPSNRDWLELRSTLQLRVLPAAESKKPDAATSLQLPESFDSMRADIETLRRTASQWLEKL